jgi:putative DNA primase/helicase
MVSPTTKLLAVQRSSQDRADPKSAFVPYSILKPIGAKTLANAELPKQRRHWHAQIRDSRLGMIYGPRGSGKSTFVISLALSMAHQREFLGHRSGGCRRVIVLDGEMDLKTLQLRTIQAASALKVELDNDLAFVSPELFSVEMPSLATAEGQEKIDDALGSKWDVLFIDNYSAFSAGGREGADSWAPWIRWMLHHKRKGRTVIMVHHSGKNGQQRGSSKHEDALDFVISLKPLRNAPRDGALRFVFEWAKARHMVSDHTMPFVATFSSTDDGAFRWSRSSVEDGDTRHKEAQTMHTSGKSQTEIARTLGVDRSTVSRWLK